MEVIKLDRSSIESKFRIEDDLKSIISTLEQEFEKDKSVICRLKVNGMALSESDEQRLAKTTRNEIHEIEIEVEQVAVLLRATLSELQLHLKSIANQALQSAEIFRRGKSHPAGLSLAELVRNIQTVTDGLVAIRPHIFIDSSAPERELEWTDYEMHMAKSIKELIAAYEKQDFVLVGDVLEYEIYNLAQNWLKFISQLP